jgi:hypothetical protein
MQLGLGSIYKHNEVLDVRLSSSFEYSYFEKKPNNTAVYNLASPSPRKAYF